MAKYKLVMKELDFKNILEFEADGLEDVIANMEIFLNGSGFFFDGALDIHTGKVETNAMHHMYTADIDDVITDSDQLDMEIKDDTGRQSQETS